MHTRKLRLIGAGFLALGWGSICYAQDTSVAEPPAQKTEASAASAFGDVVVTARRRAESVQTVPIAVSVLTGQALESQHIVALTDLQSRTPSLRFSSLGVAGTYSYSIRGQRSHDNRANQDQAVILYLNDAAMAPQPGAALEFYDLASVQVLKGPQGTLFGRNTTGGAVLLSSTKPGDRLEGYAKAEGGSYGRYAAEAAVTLPVNDQLSFRLAGKFVRQDGFGQVLGGPYQGKDLSNEREEDFRISMVYRPTSNLENYLVYYRDHFYNNGNAMIAKEYDALSSVRLYNGQPPLNLPNYFADLAKLGPDVRFDTYQNRNSFVNHQVQGVINTTTYDLGETVLGDLSFKNIFSWRRANEDYEADFDGTSADLFSVLKFEHFRSYSEEFQIAGKKKGLDWIIGAYYFKVEGDDVPLANFFGGLSPTNPINGGQFIRNTSKAVYAQTTYNLGNLSHALEKFNFTAGARYTWETRFQTAYPQQGTPGGGLVCRYPAADLDTPFPACGANFETTFRRPTWTFSLDYRFDPSKMVYFTQRRGFRSGGWNAGSTSRATNVPFLPETVDDFEFGLKADWDVSGIPLRTNIALYQSNFSDIQRQNSQCIPNGVGGCDVTSIINNASKARIRGVETEFEARLAKFFELSGFYTYTNASYIKYDYTLPSGVTLDLSNNEFAYLPKHSLGITGRFIAPLSSDEGELSAALTYTWQSGQWLYDPFQTQYFAFIGRPDFRSSFRQESYGVVDLNINWTNVMGSDFDFAVWGKNLTDTFYRKSNSNLITSAGFAYNSWGDPRTFGASVTWRFGR